MELSMDITMYLIICPRKQKQQTKNSYSLPLDNPGMWDLRVFADIRVFYFPIPQVFSGSAFFPCPPFYFFHPTSIIKQHSHRNWFVSSRLLMFLVETLHKNDTQEEEENLIKWSKLCLKVVIKGSKCTVELVLYLIHKLCTGMYGQVLHYVRGQLDKRKRKDLLLSSNGDPFINRVLGRTILCFTYGGLL